ncbi:hypothetical protein [Streptomyces sp. NRRL S-813]|uniref:hypothetical protein n=1 Tax=Streptomyces sp. NRRL S-813 TaxID=1463919 RepID=UPI00131A7498|nr:hypothetical protein [Streptomyces sp. NRRL S-813]
MPVYLSPDPHNAHSIRGKNMADESAQKSPSNAARDSVPAEEEKRKGPNWAAFSFVINLVRLARDWFTNGHGH